MINGLAEPKQRHCRLLITPVPIDGESVYGYLLRLWEANHICSARLRGTLPGISIRLACSYGAKAVHALASERRSLADFEDTEDARDNPLSKRQKPYRTETRVCPFCLRESGYWRADWDLPLSLGCRLHKCSLLDRCQGCGVYMRFARWRSVFHCHCGWDFRFGATSALPPWYSTLEAVFRPWSLADAAAITGDNIRSREAQSAYTLGRLVRVIDGVPTSSKRGEEHAFRLQPANADSVSAFLYRWPKGAQQAIGPALAAMTARQRTCLKRKLRMEDLPELQAALANCFDEAVAIRRSSAHRQLRREFAPPKGFVSLYTYCEQVGGSYSGLLELFRTGAFAGSAMSIIGRRVPWVTEEELQVGLAIQRQAPSLREAARFLQCPVLLLVALNAHGFLPAIIDPRAPRVIRFRQTELVKLVEAFAQRARGVFEPSNEFLLISQLAPRRAHEAPTWFRLFNRIRCREVPVFHAGAPGLALSNFAVRASDARPFKLRYRASKSDVPGRLRPGRRGSLSALRRL